MGSPPLPDPPPPPGSGGCTWPEVAEKLSLAGPLTPPRMAVTAAVYVVLFRTPVWAWVSVTVVFETAVGNALARIPLPVTFSEYVYPDPLGGAVQFKVMAFDASNVKLVMVGLPTLLPALTVVVVQRP